MEKNYTDHRGEPRVVITGMGAVTPIGNTTAEAWESLMVGRSGISTIKHFDVSDLPCKIAGMVKDFDVKKFVKPKEARRMARVSHLALAAATEAIADAGYVPYSEDDDERSGVLVGTAIGGFQFGIESMETYRAKGLSKVSPYAIVGALPNMVSHFVSALAKARGPINTVSTACATGTQAIGEAVDLIKRGRADRMIAGGADSLVHPATLAGFAAMRGLCISHNDDPGRACRPFTLNRNGFIVSEGAGVVILEKMSDAIARGAKIYAEVLGHASSSDAYHIAEPDPDGKGAVRAMKWAIADSHLTPRQIGYINAHGSSTPFNDRSETVAIKKMFGEYAYDLPISSTKALTGHSLGAAGAIEAIFTALAIHKKILPPTWNYDVADPDCDLDYIPNKPRHITVDYAMSNSFGLGGQNACLVLGRA
ncbi:MAG: 3-oxoacyl-[acyl-carrier-protein] synthase II [Cellvibrionaceae bacterium]|jgi:3-oxoacyl-[acyl-carrier-protein] synthase II